MALKQSEQREARENIFNDVREALLQTFPEKYPEIERIQQGLAFYTTYDPNGDTAAIIKVSVSRDDSISIDELAEEYRNKQEAAEKKKQEAEAKKEKMRKQQEAQRAAKKAMKEKKGKGGE